MNIYEKLLEVRKACDYLQKKKHEGAVTYDYVSSSDVLFAVREAMNEHGLLLIPQVTSHTLAFKDAVGGKQHMTEIDMTFTWVNIEDPKETLEIAWYGQGVDTGEKGVGKAYTYAEKYFILKFFNIPTDKDDPDAFQKKQGAEPKAKPTDPINKQQWNNLMGLGGGVGMKEEETIEMYREYSKKHLNGIPLNEITSHTATEMMKTFPDIHSEYMKSQAE